MPHEVVFTVSPEGLKALHKELKRSLYEIYEFLDTADRTHEFQGYQIWEWASLEWGGEIHRVLQHGLLPLPKIDYRLIIMHRENKSLEVFGDLCGPFDVMAGTTEQGFPTNWIHVDVGYATSWAEFGSGGDGIAPLGKQE